MLPLCVLFLATLVAGQDYGEVLHKSILFYEAQRAGALPDDNRISWRGDSALDDGNDVGAQLSGGWFDAGDHVKFGFPMAATTTFLSWGIIEFWQGYDAVGEFDNVLNSIKWPLDYFLNCVDGAGAGITVHGQVGDGYVDHAWWGRPEDMTMNRPTFSLSAPNGPGTELAGETAAAMAAGSIVFRGSDPNYADRLLSVARDLYNFAYDYPGVYTDTITNARDFYNSWNGYNDELCWSAAWLYAATGEEFYLYRALDFQQEPGDRWDWDDKQGGCHLLLFILEGQQSNRDPVERLLRSWFPGGSVPYTPGGLAWIEQWGPNRYSSNIAFLALIAAEYGIEGANGRNFAQSQIRYILGDNPLGRSYVVGYGNNPPHSVHHRGASCPDRPNNCDWNDYNNPNPNPQILEGALAGGPDQNDNFEDDRTDYIKNEVACDYNSGFQGAIAGLITLSNSNGHHDRRTLYPKNTAT